MYLSFGLNVDHSRGNRSGVEGVQSPDRGGGAPSENFAGEPP